jgi:hypothetical protein
MTEIYLYDLKQMPLIGLLLVSSHNLLKANGTLLHFSRGDLQRLKSITKPMIRRCSPLSQASNIGDIILTELSALRFILTIKTLKSLWNKLNSMAGKLDG